MATFSSVARKPGQTLKPKAVPRRNAPRHVERTAAGTLESLTPESLPQSPNVQPISERDPPSDTALVRESTSRPTEQDGDALPTPPATVEGPSPPPELRAGAETRHIFADPAPTQVQSTEQDTANGRSETSALEAQTRSGRKRRAAILQDGPVPVQAVTSHNETSTAKPQAPKSSAPARKRRKVAPQAAPSYLLSRPAEPNARATTGTPARRRSSSVAEERARAATDDLLQQATAQFGSVSQIAGSIENRTRSLRPRRGRMSRTASYAEAEGEDDTAARPRKRRSTRSSAIEDLASAVIDRAVGRGRKKRRSESEVEVSDPENYEIDEDTVTMSSLTKDRGLGKRSATGKELEENWEEISKRWKERPEENRKRAKEKKEEEKRKRKEREKNKTSAQLEDGEELVSPGPTIPSFGVRQVIINGNIVADPDSRNVDFSTNVERRAAADEGSRKDVRRIYDYVNSNRIGKHAGLRGSSNRWGDESTELFYKGLRMFGTDFEMIASLFPNRTRKEIKDKYNKLEREEWDMVQDSLKNREPCAIEEYAEMVGQDSAESFLEPEVLEAELTKQKERLEKEAAERLVEENRLTHVEGADEPIQSIEVDADGHEIVRETTEGPADERTRRVQELADAVVEAAVAPAAAKKTRRPRTRDTSRITKTKKGRQTLAGTEEVIGTVHDVER